MLNVDERNCRIEFNGGATYLGRKTRGLQILAVLARRPNFRWTSEELVEHIWGQHKSQNLGSDFYAIVNAHAWRIRTQLRKSRDPNLIDLSHRIKSAGGSWYLDLSDEQY